MISRHVLVVESDGLIRGLLAKALEADGFTVVATPSVELAKTLIVEFDPDALVIAVESGADFDGFDLAASVAEVSPETGIVFLTDLPDPRFVGKEPSVVTKRNAYLRKGQIVDAGEVIAALDAVLTGTDLRKFRHDLMQDRPFANLSKKQIEVLLSIAEGLTNQQIASERGTTVRAVEGLVSRTFEAMGIEVSAEGNARVEAVRKLLLTTRPRS